MEEKDLIAAILSGLALLLTFVNIWIFYRIESRKKLKEFSYKNIEFVLEIDKLLIDDPRLWSIFDSHYITPYIDSADLVLKAKKDAFLYYVLNSFEIVFENFQNHPKTEHWEKWKNFLRTVIFDSFRLRELIEVELHNDTYSNEFSHFLKTYLNDYALIANQDEGTKTI